MDAKLKHMDLIQSIITRMANNSFLLKGWAVTLLSGIFALAWNQESIWHFILAYIPVVMFWFLDSYYLQQERLYRGLYDKVRQTDEKDINFSMKAPLVTENKKYRYVKVLFSKTEAGFYIPLLIIITIFLISYYANVGCHCADVMQ